MNFQDFLKSVPARVGRTAAQWKQAETMEGGWHTR